MADPDLACEQCGARADRFTIDGADSKLICPEYPWCLDEHQTDSERRERNALRAAASPPSSVEPKK
jgi:hypothetical protein